MLQSKKRKLEHSYENDIAIKDFNLRTHSIYIYQKECEEELKNLKEEDEEMRNYFLKEIKDAERRINIRLDSISKYVNEEDKDFDLFLLNVSRKECRGRALIDRIPSGRIRDKKDSLFSCFNPIYQEVLKNIGFLNKNVCSIITEYVMADYIEWQFDIVSYSNAQFVDVFEDTLFATRDGKSQFAVNFLKGVEPDVIDCSYDNFDFYANCEKFVVLRGVYYFEAGQRCLIRTYENAKKELLETYYEIENLKEGDRIYHVEPYDYERLLYIKGQGNEFTVSVGVLRI
jgi:hypothetical protein